MGLFIANPPRASPDTLKVRSRLPTGSLVDELRSVVLSFFILKLLFTFDLSLRNSTVKGVKIFAENVSLEAINALILSFRTMIWQILIKQNSQANVA